MANAHPSGVTLSLLDRLTDVDPKARREGPPGVQEAIRRYTSGLCRDLTALLNTRRGDADFDPGYKQCVASLLTYGIPDFTAYNLTNSIELEDLRQSMERAIRQFEPRLERATVSMAEPDPLRPILQFQITALLRIDAGSEPVVFDVSLSRASRRLIVSGAD
jgi:type VI secretion system protein ImpF